MVELWSQPVLWISFVFYFLLSNLCQVVADLYMPPSFIQPPPTLWQQFQRWLVGPLAEIIHDLGLCKKVAAEEEKLSEKELSKRHEVVQAWITSFVHALLTTVFGLWIFFVVQAEEERNYVFLLMHTCGYFLADTIVNPSIMFALHHLCPFPFLWVLMAHDASLRNACMSLVFAEAGNAVSHGATLLTCKTGLPFQVIRAASFWLSRPPSMYFAYQAFVHDVPEIYHGTWVGHGCFTMVFIVAFINLGWMLAMLLPPAARYKVSSWCNRTSTVKLD